MDLIVVKLIKVLNILLDLMVVDIVTDLLYNYNEYNRALLNMLLRSF